MGDKKLDSIREKKRKDYIKQQALEEQQLEKQQNVEDNLKRNLRVMLETKAYDRLMNVKLVNYQLFMAASQYIVQQLAPRLQNKLTEDELVSLLKKIKGNDSQGSIIVRR